MKRLLEIITNNFNKGLMESPHDFFLRDTSYEELIDYLNRTIESLLQKQTYSNVMNYWLMRFYQDTRQTNG